MLTEKSWNGGVNLTDRGGILTGVGRREAESLGGPKVNTIARAAAVVLVVVLSALCLTSGSTGLPEGQFTLQAIPVSALQHVWNANGTSLNWSGYVAESNFAAPLNGAVSDVKGTWVVPTVAANGATSAYSSTWVGMDGFSDDTVEQVGTDSDWTNRTPSYYAWFELYPQYAYRINGFLVRPGDTISAEVHYTGNGEFVLTLINVSRRIIFSTTVRDASAKRESAEWITEAPSAGNILPLADFGKVTFSSCSADISGRTGPINDTLWQNDVLTMETVSGVTKAKPSALSANGTRFSTTWDHQ
jgi:hypothetical protein